MIVELDTVESIKNYDELIDNSINGTCFAYSWFLKLKNTNKILKIKKNDKLISIMPLFLKDNKICQSTMYIPYGGPIFINLPDEERNRIRLIREVESRLSIYLKNNFNEFSFSTDPYLEDIMPFIRNNILPELRYTYKIDLTSDLNNIYNNFGRDRKKEIRRCKKNNIEIILDKDLKYFSCEKCVEWEKKYNFPSSKDFVKKYIKKSIEKNRGMCYVAKKGDTIYGAVYISWDKKNAYILYSYFDHEKDKDIGVIAYLYYFIFNDLKNRKIKAIDFEGSVYESVENYNISFGAKQKRYYNLHYNKNNIDEIIRNMYNYYEK